MQYCVPVIGATMRRPLILFAVLLLSACQEATGPGKLVATAIGVPPGWFGGGSAGYTIGQTAETHSGDRAAFISGEPGVTGFASMGQTISVEGLRGKRVRWSGWLKTRKLTTTVAGLWVRADGPQGTVAFDNMTWAAPDMAGDHDWRQMAVVIDVPQTALGITLGLLLNGSGVLVADDLSLEEVPTTVAVTNPDFVATPNSNADSASVAATYASARDTPLNVDFEAGGEPTDESITWLKSHLVPLTSASTSAPASELDALNTMIGTARIVGLGEATHGTSQFFSLKDRILRHLVQNMGFTRFAIEATSPEADEVNRYVLGESTTPPATLIGNLYFWTVDAQEVVEMVDWMRSYNTTVEPSQRVQFLGFDMQYPGASIDSVEAFIARVDPANTSYVGTRIDCIRPYRNVGSHFSKARSGYTVASTETKAACAAALAEVSALLASTPSYEAAEPAHFQAVLHASRMVQQFESMIAPPSTTASSFARDKAMAENVEWILDQAGSDAKIVLWAHNGHVTKSGVTMGGLLHQAYGNAYVNVGFTFGAGGFNAVGPPQNLVSLWNISYITPGSLEQYFSLTGTSFALFDARQIASGGAAASRLGQPLLMRSIGSTYNPAAASNFFQLTVLPRDYDLVAWVAQANASTLLR
jgi:erythromycin esterase